MNQRVRDIIAIGVLPAFFVLAVFSDYLPFTGATRAICVFMPIILLLAVACYFQLRDTGKHVQLDEGKCRASRQEQGRRE
ncbi:MAG TPA: hypothetical protein VMV10_31135 [Pirellulales bacterium]|nr:hypothetical protein [Pirellulales bacterium]